MKATSIIGAMIIVGVGYMVLFGAVINGVQQSVAQELSSSNISSKVARDYMSQGNVATTANDWRTACVHYGVAKHSYLRAGDEKMYREAMQAQKESCDLAR